MPAIIIALVLAMTAGTGAVVASGDALPGEALYPVKRAAESAQSAAAFSPEAQAAVHLSQAETRLKELEQLKDKPNAAQHLRTTAEQVTQQQQAAEEAVLSASKKGKDVDALMAKLRANLERQQAVLQRVLDKAPEQAKGALQHAMEVSQQGLQKAMEQQSKTRGPKDKESGSKPQESEQPRRPERDERPEAASGSNQSPGPRGDSPPGRR